MKIILFSSIALIALITIFSCKKSNKSTTTPTITTSQWVYNNTTYKGDTTYFVGNGNGAGYTLESDYEDTTGNYAEIAFSIQPTKSGTFTVVDQNANATATQCVIYFGNNADDYGSSGGGTVTLTIANGKITGFFSNINATDGTHSKTVSGTLIASDN